LSGVTASAPARVDLAGGTLDLWPLYLLHPNSKTVNLAIDRRARASVSKIDGGFELLSHDLRFDKRFEDARQARGCPEAAIASEAALALGLESGFRIETWSSVPFGSGLGGSSALLVAIVSALARMSETDLPKERICEICRDVETRVLQAPAGTQDYESALRGGLNVISFGVGGAVIETRPVPVEEFSKHLVLFDSGQSHSSGLNNWEIYKARIDGDATVRDALDGIRDCAETLARASRILDFEAMGRALGEEWAFRKRLSKNVSSELLEEAERRSKSAGAWGAKACGAGGGGVLAVLTPSDRCDRVAGALAGLGRGALFPARPDNDGVAFEI
jgi:D-glycero-alpha-D-manno-heptose-7-phosphate kinase